jgi:chromosome segregation ATPase
VNTQIQQGSSGSSQEMSVTQQTLEQVQGVVGALEKELNDLDLEEDDREELDAQMTTIKGQLGSRKPRMEIVKASLATIKDILESATAVGVAAGKISGFAAAVAKVLGLF